MTEELPDGWYELPDLPQLREDMGDRLAKLRLRRGWKQCDVADYLGISAHRLSAYEYGDNAVPYDVLVGFCDLYGVTADYLIGFSEEEGPAQ